MKRFVSLLLIALILFSTVPTAFAALGWLCEICGDDLCVECEGCVYCGTCTCVKTNDYTQGTQVVFEATGAENYSITVPAKLNPGQSGIVTLSGSWPANKTISVVADSTVTLTNNILNAETKTLNVIFKGISAVGDNVVAQTFSENVVVERVSNVLFGTWSGRFNYTVTSSILDSTTTEKDVAGLGMVKVDNPNVEITYDPNTGNADGFVPPSDDNDESFDVPDEEAPKTIVFNYGKFESNTQYTPGQYVTVEYVENVLTIKQPASHNIYKMAWWNIQKDGNGNISSITAEPPLLSRVPHVRSDINVSTYMAYTFDDAGTLEMNGVDSEAIWFVSIENDKDDTLENAIYLAAVAQQRGLDVHVAQWDGTQYVDLNQDAEIDAIDSFFEITPVTKTKEVLVAEPSTTTTYVYVPMCDLVAEEGMTWREWLASDYNTTGIANPAIKTSDYQDVSYDEVILADGCYGFAEYALQGAWIFGEYRPSKATLEQEINFVATGVAEDENITAFEKIRISYYEGYHLQKVYVDYVANDIAYPNYNMHSADNSLGFEEKWLNRTIDFGLDPQDVSEEFYNWFIANATPVT